MYLYGRKSSREVQRSPKIRFCYVFPADEHSLSSVCQHRCPSLHLTGIRAAAGVLNQSALVAQFGVILSQID